MLSKRIIPVLHIKGPNLVKGIHLEGLRVLGLPGSFAQYYYENGADELIYIDTVASLYGRNGLHDIIREATKGVFVPVSVGGGIRSTEDVESLMRCGVEKVIVNTAIIQKPVLITEIANRFGSQAICAYIEARKSGDKWECLTDNGREETGKDVLEWVKEVQERGAGEIFISSVDRDGTGIGMDRELLASISNHCSVPLLFHGGYGKIDHAVEVINDIEGLCISSALHYKHLEICKELTFAEGNTQFLKGELGSMKRKNITPISIKDIKKHLHKEGVKCRMKW